MKKGLVLISFGALALAALAGCSSMQTHQANNDGTHTLSCHSINGTDENCIKKAEIACNDGFSIVEHQSHKIEYASSGDGYYMPPKHILTVLCKPA